MAYPQCPDCAKPMRRRTARRGPNAGNEFWGCSDYPGCKGTRSIGEEDGGKEGPASAESKRSSVQRQPRPVSWEDGTLQRTGWRCQHVSLSGSLRSITTQDAQFAQTAFVARQDLDAFQPVDRDTRRVIDMWVKILSRGSASPIHPAAEEELLSAEGFGPGDFRPPAYVGDLAPRLQVERSSQLTVPTSDEFSLEERLVGSDAEAEFLVWLGKSHPELISFVTPQASLDQLLAASGFRSEGFRRVDFLISVPDGNSTVIEIDGGQHDAQRGNDDRRDEDLAACGIRTIRIPTAELALGRGPNLSLVENLADSLPVDSRQIPIDNLVWVPILLHRLGFALGEALSAGFLAGERWVVSLVDPTHRLADLLGPYLEMFWALDSLWGETTLSPTEVTLIDGEKATTYTQGLNGSYERSDGVLVPADVLVELDIVNPPAAELAADPELPTIIVRTAPIGVAVSRPPAGGSTRIPAKSGEATTEIALTILLQAIFAKAEFRPGQAEAVAELIAGRDCCVLLPTGAGKSLIYQLAGLCLPGRTLIVDPIVSLIEDQIAGLEAHGIDRAIGLTRETTRQGQTKALLREVAEGDAYFVFVAPERLQMSEFRTALRQLAVSTPVNLAVLDEAHCVSEWGHDFRTSYLGLGRVIRETCADTVGSPPPLAALTGTASRAVLRDVLFQLSIEERTPNTIIRPTTFDRKELNYRIVRCTPDMAEASLRSVLRTLPGDFNEAPATFFQANGDRTHSGLVFVPTVNGKKNGLLAAQRILSELCPQVGIYGGTAPKGSGLGDWERAKRKFASAFKDNTSTCLVATKAFGMGIDKPNIRWVVHYGLSGSIESYYQEVGRAGRNGERAQCVLILSEFDEARNSQLLAEDVGLEEARTRSESLNWGQRDDVTTALFFHVNSFPGAADELAALRQVVKQLSPGSERNVSEIPFTSDAKRQERALHRLIVLGVVDDYLVEFGSRKFEVTLRGSDSADVKRSLLAFVERTQPGRLEDMTRRVDRVEQTHHLAIEQCGEILIDFVYETVERSRRRSLREMLLAARQSNTDEQLRARVLEYLSEGDVGNVLENLVDQAQVNLSDWIRQWDQIRSRSDAAEWRASSARLLASYPDHPGLLFSRGLSELLATAEGTPADAAVDEYVLNLESALQSATPNYGVSTDQLRTTITWLLESVAAANSAVAAATLSVAARYGAASLDDLAALRRNAPEEPAAAIVYLDETLAELLELAESITTGSNS